MATRAAEMHSTIAIDVAAPADARLRARPRRRALGAAAPPLRAVAGGRRAARGRLARRRLRRAPAARSTSSGSALPVTWRARTWDEPATRRLRFVHVAGATKGMDVTWRIEPVGGGSRVSIDHDFRPRLPVFATVRRSVLHAADRGPDARHVQGARRGPRGRARHATASPERPPDESTDMSDRRRIWITGHRDDHRHRHRPRRVPRRAARRPLAVKRIDRFDPSAVPLAGRGPGRRLRSARLDAAQDRPPARSVQPVRAGRRSARAR